MKYCNAKTQGTSPVDNTGAQNYIVLNNDHDVLKPTSCLGQTNDSLFVCYLLLHSRSCFFVGQPGSTRKSPQDRQH